MASKKGIVTTLRMLLRRALQMSVWAALAYVIGFFVGLVVAVLVFLNETLYIVSKRH